VECALFLLFNNKCHWKARLIQWTLDDENQNQPSDTLGFGRFYCFFIVEVGIIWLSKICQGTATATRAGESESLILSQSWFRNLLSQESRIWYKFSKTSIVLTLYSKKPQWLLVVCGVCFVCGVGLINMLHKPCFTIHADTWCSPKTVPLSCFANNPVMAPAEAQKIATASVHTVQLLLTNRPLSAFFWYNLSVLSLPLNCSLQDRKSFKNNQMPTERLIGNMIRCVENRKIKGSDDCTNDNLMRFQFKFHPAKTET